MSIKTFLGKNEPLAVLIATILIGAPLIIGFLLYLSPFGTNYNHIGVEYKESGNNLLVTEEFDFNIVNEDFNVLYRSFGEPICLGLGNCNIIIKSVGCEDGTPYFSDVGKAMDPRTGNYLNLKYDYKIKSNEVGCYKESGYTDQKETMRVTYEIPKAHVEKNRFKHIFFSQDHFSIKKMSVKGLEGESEKSFIPRDNTISVDVRSGEIYVGGISPALLGMIVLAITLLPFAVWKLFGEEKNFVVPKYLHTIPEKIPAWKVDVLTNGTMEMSKNGMASLIMELYANNILRVEKYKKILTTKYKFIINKKYDSSKISSKADELLKEMLNYRTGEDDNSITCEPSPNSVRFQSFMKIFYKGREVEEYAKELLDTKGFTILFVVQFLIMFFAYLNMRAFGSIVQPIAFLLIISIILTQAIIPKSVFSRFKGDYYKKYLEWLAFNNMLNDYAQMKKYLKEDYSQWKDWLIYATALGSAEKLLKSLKELSILTPKDYDDTSRIHSYIVAYSLLGYSAAHPRSSGGGGIGGGGGFGGGGGGGR